MEAIGPALQDFASGLNMTDWLIGIIGAVLIRLFVYTKAKDAKKYRRDVEYGSARWGALSSSETGVTVQCSAASSQN